MTATFQNNRLTMVLPAEDARELRAFAQRLCVNVPDFTALPGAGVVLSIRAGDAAAFAKGAEVIASWKSDMRARLAAWFDDPTAPRPPIDAEARLSEALEQICRDHWDATDGLRRSAARFDARSGKPLAA